MVFGVVGSKWPDRFNLTRHTRDIWWVAVQELKKGGQKGVQKWLKNGSKRGHFGPKNGSFLSHF